MRTVLNRQTKLHPKWDGPFVILDSTSKDTYQLVTANGYTLPNLWNVTHLRKLDKSERAKYTGDLWEASQRLKLHDRIAKEGFDRHLKTQRRDHHRQAHSNLKQSKVQQAPAEVEGTRRSGRVRKAPKKYEG